MGSKPIQPWVLVAWLWAVCVINYADRQALPAVFPALQRQFAFTTTELGRIGSAFMIGYALTAPLAGWIGDRARRRRLIVAALVLWSAATAATAGCSSTRQFGLVRMISGIGEAFYFPAAIPLIAAAHPGATRSRALAWHQSGVYVGSIVGGGMAATLAETAGWSSGFLLLGGLGAALAATLAGALPENPPAESAAKSPPGKNVWREPAALLLALAFVAANFGASLLLVWTTTYLVERFGVRRASAGFLGPVCLNGGSALAAPWAGALADRWARRHPAGRIGAQILGAVVAAGCAGLLAVSGRLALALAALVALGLGKVFYDAGIFASLFDLAPNHRHSTAAAVMNSAGWAGGAVAPTAAGWLADHLQSGTPGQRLGISLELAACGYLAAALVLVAAGIRIQSMKRLVISP